MDFALALHTHLPYVLRHGRWPHGSDWLCEAAIDTYLPLLEQLQRLEAEEVSAPVTIGFTPVLANQLSSAEFVREFEAYLTQRLVTCDEAPESLKATGETALLPLVDFWRSRLLGLRRLYRDLDHDLLGAFRRLEAAGRLEIIGSAATHGFLPLLARDESIRLQLAVGRSEHRRLFGRLPSGCWLPECAYRPRGDWAPLPGAPYRGIRRGIEEHISDAGFQYFFTDAHLAHAGQALGIYGEVTAGLERFDVELADGQTKARGARSSVERSPYQAYRVTPPRYDRGVAAFVRDPQSSMQVWSRHHGYPGDEWYLEFHKIRWPGGLKLWRVSEPGSDLGWKRAYEPTRAQERARDHANHFAGLLGSLALGGEGRGAAGDIVVAPFDTELFGHWWFEGPDFIGGVYRALARQPGVTPVTASAHLAAHPPKQALRLAVGSWGANGDFGMWLNPQTEWTWRRLWPLEQAFWDAAPQALGRPEAWPVLAQAARELLLAQSSDWQFMISTGAVADYAERRILEHCDDAERLVAALAVPGGSLEEAWRRTDELARRDDLFPDVLSSLALVVNGSRAFA
jgi:1,4-alpha-glucan branching enzyme